MTTNLQHSKPKHAYLIDRVIRRTDGHKTGLVTNIDGTLSPVTDIPGEVEVSPACRKDLAKLVESGKFEVIAVISGRSAADSRRLVGLPQLHYIGNNGLEVLAPGSSTPRPVKAARPYLSLISIVLETIEYSLRNTEAKELDFLEGNGWVNKLIFENKGFVASIHYRQFINESAIKKVILEKIELVVSQSGLRIENGNKSIEIRPPVKVNKSTALQELRELYGLKSFIYLGSDMDDIEAFQTIKQLTQEHYRVNPDGVVVDEPEFLGINLAVCNPQTPPKLVVSADYLLDGVVGVEKFLTGLASRLKK